MIRLWSQNPFRKKGSSTTASAVGDSTAQGTSSDYAATDHKHGREAFATPGSSAVGDSAAAGTATTVPRSDHVHGREAFATPSIVLGTTAAAGSATTPIRSDSTIVAFDSTNPANIGTAATGSQAVAARRDHVHATGAGTPTTSAVGDSASTGTGPAAAMTDHVHGRESFGNPDKFTGLSANGSAATPARSDHKHGWDVQGSAPGSPTEGQAYYDSTTHKLYVYDGSTWQGCW